MVLRKNSEVLSLGRFTSNIEQRRIAAQDDASLSPGTRCECAHPLSCYCILTIAARRSHCDSEATKTCWACPEELRYSCGKSHTEEPEHCAIAGTLLSYALQSLLACTPRSRAAKALLSESLAGFAETLTDLASELLEDDRSQACWEQESELEVEAANDTDEAIAKLHSSVIHQRDCGHLTQSTLDLQSQFLSSLQQELLVLHRFSPRRREFSRGHICSRAVPVPGSREELMLKDYWQSFADWKIAVERLEEHNAEDGQRSWRGGPDSASILLSNVDPAQEAQDARRTHLVVEVQMKGQEVESMKATLLESGIEPELLEEDGLFQVLSRKSCGMCAENAQHHIIWRPEEGA